jgi:hypothetical protein
MIGSALGSPNRGGPFDHVSVLAAVGLHRAATVGYTAVRLRRWFSLSLTVPRNVLIVNRSVCFTVTVNESSTTALLHDVLDAHGGTARWEQLATVQATLASGGLLFDLKNQTTDHPVLQVAVALHRVWASVRPFGGPELRSVFTADRTAIERSDGTVLAEQRDVRRSFAGHELSTPWNPLQRTYFSGYAVWNYLNLPFLLTRPGMRLQAVAPVEHQGRTLLGISALFPVELPTHCREQRFYFGPDRLLRRNDYRVEIAGGFPASQYLDDYVVGQGICIPTTRRAYLRDEHDATLWDHLMVSLRFTDVQFCQ